VGECDVCLVGNRHTLIGPQMITNYDTYLIEKKGAFSNWDLTLCYRFAKQWEVKGGLLGLNCTL
jgi:vitamin B12 transporter